MKLYLANSSNQKIGGGWTFLANLKKGLKTEEVTDNYEEASHYFISGPTMVGREEVMKAKKDGKKIVLRLDNAVRNSRNRNTGMSRMKDFSDIADLVIYQSRWAFDYLFEFTKTDGTVIHNGVDQDIFNSAGRLVRPNNYIYSRYNRDETKNWEMARYTYSQINRHNEDAKLYIIGNFSPELANGNFDFYMGENYEYVGIVSDPQQMAEYYKKAGYIIYTYFNDACSNTLIEALCCGVRPHDEYEMIRTGGTPEIMQEFITKGDEYFSLHRMANEYRSAMNAI